MSSIEDALELHRLGKIEQAQKLYQKQLKRQPSDADSQHLLGVTNLQLGKLELAQQQIKKAIKINHQIADYWINLSQAEKLNGDSESALASLSSALELEPNHTQAWNNLGNLQQQLEQHHDAIESYNQALKLQPNYANAHYNLSISLAKQAALSKAIEHCKTALQLEPKNVEYWGQFGQFLVTAGHQQQAKKILQQGLAIHPDNIQLSCELASLIASDGELESAIEIYQKVLLQKPDHALALSQLLYLKRSVCDWQNLEQYFIQLVDAIDQQQPYISPFSFLTENSSPAQQLKCAKLWSQRFMPINTQKQIPKKRQKQTPKKSPTAKIVIGYVSADYYQHPTAYLAARLFEQHDRTKFKIIAYSNSRDDKSDMTHRLKSAFDLFVDIKSLSINQIVEKIQRDKVDILVDLKGYTLEAATEIFARRAAPIQVNYLGYPGTMGASFMDYIIGDPFVTPIAAATDFSEKIVQLDCCYQINDNQRSHPTTAPSKNSLGLPQEQFIFGCFNNSWKITADIFALWMKILKQCPKSILWLMDRHPKSNFNCQIFDKAQHRKKILELSALGK